MASAGYKRGQLQKWTHEFARYYRGCFVFEHLAFIERLAKENPDEPSLITLQDILQAEVKEFTIQLKAARKLKRDAEIESTQTLIERQTEVLKEATNNLIASEKKLKQLIEDDASDV
jgi:hypothetical protein